MLHGDSSLSYYSLLKLFTGLTSAALTAWKLTVAMAISAASNPAIAKIHQYTGTRYAKPFSHPWISHHAIGADTTKANSTSARNSRDNKNTICPTDAPTTFRTP